MKPTPVVYLISQLAAGKEFEEILPVALAFDHINFIMVVTNLIFAMLILSSDVADKVNRIVYWGVNIGVAGFAINGTPISRVNNLRDQYT